MAKLDTKKRTETKLCECGCGQSMLKYRLKLRNGKPNGYYERRYINGHSRKNKPVSKEHAEKISKAQKGQKRGPAWNKGKSNYWAKGALNNKWKGGITPETTKQRNHRKTREWRTSIYEMFDYTCQMCGARSGNGKKVILNAHHVQTWSGYPRLRWNILNGVCLCVNCHNKIKNREKEFEPYFIALIQNRVNSGEALRGNPERSSLNSIKVSENVQRLIGEELTNKPNTSARRESDDIVCPSWKQEELRKLKNSDKQRDTWWDAQETTSVGGFSSNGLSNMRSMVHDIEATGSGKPQLITTTQSILESFESEIDVDVRYMKVEKLNRGAEVLAFRNIEITMDDDVPSGHMYFLNPDHLELLVDSDGNLSFDEFKSQTNSKVMTSLLALRWQLISTNPRGLGRLTGIS